MSSERCPHCGKLLDAPHDDFAGAVLDLDAATGEHPIVPDISAGSAPRAGALSGDGSSAQRALPVLLALGVLTALIVAVIALTRSDDSAAPADDDPAAAAAPATPAPVEAEPATGVGLEPADALAAAGLASDSVAEFFRSWVDDDRRWSIVYPSPMGLQVLNADGSIQPSTTVAAGFEEAARLPLISDGNRTWAVDPENPADAYLVSTQFFVTDIDRDGRVAFINDSLDPPNIGESSYGAWGPGFDLPRGAEVLAVPGRGLFVLPTTGGTYEYVANGVEPLSDDVLVAASIDSEVFQRCDERLSCELYLTSPELDEPRVLDMDVETEVWVSPGGDILIAHRSGPDSVLIDLAADDERVLPGRVRAVDWADDGSRAALMTDTEVYVLRRDQGELRGVTLPIAASANAILLVDG